MKKYLLLALIALMAAACSKEETEPEITSVKITNRVESIMVGESRAFKYEYADPKAVAGSVSWSSSDPSVITVAGDGTIRAVDAGSATITLRMTVQNRDGSSKDFTDAITVKVTRPELKGIKIKTTAAAFKKGNEVDLTLTTTPAGAQVGEVEWTSNDTKVATVNGGKVKCISIGKTVITAKVKGSNISDRYEVTVVPQTVDGISFKDPSLNMTIGETTQTTIVFTPSNVDNKKVTYSSSDKTVASVDEKGVVTAHKKGKAVITATSDDGGKKATCNVEVVHFTDKITMGVSGGIVNINGYITATIWATLYNNCGKNIYVERFAVESEGKEIYHTDINKTLENGKDLGGGVRLNSVYNPVYKFVYKVDGVTYEVKEEGSKIPY